MIKYSIILRVYNAEKQVSRSIESIINQSYANWELIIINDGSTDGTGEICEKYALKDQRIVVVHQKNKGCLLATLTGVEHSTGDYICLIDSDDWYEKEYIEKVNFVFCTQKVDMVVTNYNVIGTANEKKKFCLVEEDCITDKREAIKKFLETTNYALWNKFIAKDRIRYTKEELNFYKSSGKATNFGDDLFLLMPVLSGCEKIYFISQCLYNYTIGEQSISHKATKDDGEELINRSRLMQFVYETIEQNGLMDQEIHKLIQVDTVVILMPNIKNMIKSGQIEKTLLRSLKKNSFYRNIIIKTKFKEISPRIGRKRAIAFLIFNLLVLLS